MNMVNVTSIFNADLAVIGGGPGGYVAAIRAAQLGKKVIIVDKNGKSGLGGVCLNSGCIPTKSLIKSAEVYLLAQRLSSYGIEVQKQDIRFNLDYIVERSRRVIAQLSSGINSLMSKNNIEILDGYATLRDNCTISVVQNNGKQATIKSKNIILATGSHPRIMKGFEPNSKIWYYKDAIQPTYLPKSIIIVGSGAIGVEFASFYNALGVEITMIERSKHILSTEDHEIVDMAGKIFLDKGIKIINEAEIIEVAQSQDKLTILYKQHNNQCSITADNLIIAVGVTPNTKNLGLENTKIKLDSHDRIITNNYMQTDEDHIYAIGDIVCGPSVAHKASHEAILAAEHIANKSVYPINYNDIVSCIYSIPQIASIGLTEEQAYIDAQKNKYSIAIGKHYLAHNSKCIADGLSDQSSGMIKTIFNAGTGELLGAHMIGHEVTELIQGCVIGKKLEATAEELTRCIWPHPTLSESTYESILDALGNAIHK